MAERIRSLAELATKNGVHVEPAAANFGFSIYQNSNRATRNRILGKQLAGIGEVATALFNAKVSASTRCAAPSTRTGAVSAPRWPTAGPGGVEALKGKIFTPDHGLYTVYPFEFEFTGSEESLRNFLTNISTSSYVLVPRLLYISSKRPPAPHRRPDQRGRCHGLAGKRPPTFLVAMGNDEVHVRARIDLIDWVGQKEARTPGQEIAFHGSILASHRPSLRLVILAAVAGDHLRVSSASGDEGPAAVKESGNKVAASPRPGRRAGGAVEDPAAGTSPTGKGASSLRSGSTSPPQANQLAART